MISFQFETYIADGAEHYSYGADYGKGMVQTSKTVSFPESLLSLVDMNIDEIEPAIRQLNEVLWQLTTTREKQYAEEVNALLDELELRHIYFQQLALDWRYRLSLVVIFLVTAPLFFIVPVSLLPLTYAVFPNKISAATAVASVESTSNVQAPSI